MIRSMWGFSSLTRDRTHIRCTAGQILNHWTTGRCLSVNSESDCSKVLLPWTSSPEHLATEHYKTFRIVCGMSRIKKPGQTACRITANLGKGGRVPGHRGAGDCWAFLGERGTRARFRAGGGCRRSWQQEDVEASPTSSLAT